MPPQLTNISSEAEHDAAVLRLDQSIALAKQAMDEVLAAAARLNVSVATPGQALSGREAAAAAPAQSLLGLLKRYWSAFGTWRLHPRVSLMDLSDRELTDIGLTRAEINYLAPGRAIDALRDSTRYLLSRGM
ncbi:MULTISPECIES: DUF1127 domain-containing protein [Bradyrhizobium]|uniref:DUF1127 domain-containing protein n=1 Tax=Bradyrhizobium TaxID=374 RepID=UPI001CD757EB|nr:MULTISPECIES: DUF1127 domain-containing protein [Bradyrhizobium]MCA1375145.1 DUF1127 domain-containing protein [Bradyrhizobium sp. IC4060]MCA1486058.1 DUF1127 domain-containing protein [Bradyrhizobium sp. IC4061]MCA1528469.1 DUF1127 domain-containing protein [Bradyrhizobium yuanmingense]MCA1543193.1 DUF1127 domain-containing protein [Bradyrhizobium sp. NBAIM32]MCA1551898.1 DUF1127 domain-containing protein [Bradyrhizobium sp. BRP19]